MNGNSVYDYFNDMLDTTTYEMRSSSSVLDGSFSQYFWGKNAIFTTAPNTSVQVAPKATEEET